jgi:hypothetical protein
MDDCPSEIYNIIEWTTVVTDKLVEPFNNHFTSDSCEHELGIATLTHNI